MSDIDDSLSPERQELLRYILDDNTLPYCHERYPGAVRLEIVRRTRVVLRIHGSVVRYHLPQHDQGAVELTVEASQRTLSLKRSHPALWSLGLHIAAEAMLALRNGHKEHNRVQKRKHKADVT